MSFRTLVLLSIIPSAILHEVSHGVVAYAFGDDTAKRAGRISLNPVRHIDPFGTVLLPAMMALTGIPAFAYAKPVPVNVRKLRNPRDHALLVSLAGPLTNAVLAVGAALALHGVSAVTAGDLYDASAGGVTRVLFAFGIANVLLATFNLIPLPPLDGSAVVERLLPARWWPGWLRFRRYSFGVFLLLFLGVPGFFDRILDPALRLWGNLL